MWAIYDKDGMVTGALGGGYTVMGETYQEIPEYGIGGIVDALKGKAQTFKRKIEGNKWYHNGKLSTGRPIEEVWERVERVKRANAQVPNFSGTWRLSLERSKPFRYDSFVMHIDHREPKLFVKQLIKQRESRTIEFEVTTDGKEHKSTIMGLSAVAHATWEGKTLVTLLKRDLPNGGQLQSIRKATLTEEGKTITAKVELTINGQKLEGEEFWEKQ